jgi:hypothetical protein
MMIKDDQKEEIVRRHMEKMDRIRGIEMLRRPISQRYSVQHHAPVVDLANMQC